jgi:hypothetical protein
MLDKEQPRLASDAASWPTQRILSMSEPSVDERFYAGRMTILLPWKDDITARLVELLKEPITSPDALAEIVREVRCFQGLLAETTPPALAVGIHHQLEVMAGDMLTMAIDLRTGDRELALAAFERMQLAMSTSQRELQMLDMLIQPPIMSIET